MAKRNKQILLDEGIYVELQKENNASSLINQLLEQHYSLTQSDNLKILTQDLAEKSKKKKILLKEIRELKKKISKIKQKEAKILKIYNRIPQEVRNDIENDPNLTLMRLKARFVTKYKEKYSFSWMELKQVYLESNRKYEYL